MKALQLPQIVGKNLIPHEPLKLPEAITSVDPLELQEEHPIADFHHQVMEPLGFRLEATIGPCLAAVAAAAGPSINVQSGGRRLSSAINMFMVGGTPPYNSILLVSPFEMLRQHQERVICSSEYKDFGKEELEIFNGFEDVRQRQQRIDNDPMGYESECMRQAVGRGFNSPIGPSSEELPGIHRDLVRKTEDLQSRKKPLLFVESCAPDMVLKSRAQSFDGGVFHLDSGGHGTGMLLEAAPKTRKKLLDAYTRSFDRSAIIDGTTLTVPPWVCTMSLLKAEGAVDILHDSGATMRAFATRCLYVGIPGIEKGADYAKVVNRLNNKPFDKILTSLIERRKRAVVSFDFTADYRLGEKGEEAVDRFRSSLIGTTEPLTTIVAQWPDMAIKIALLFHVAETEKPEKVIPASTVQAAISYVCQAGGRGLEMCWNAGGLRTREDLEIGDRLVSVLSKVYERGPMTRRDIQRSIGGLRKADLDPIISLAIEKGILIEEKGVLRLKNQAAQAYGSQKQPLTP